MGELPSGTVTFLFTDLEGSTRLWEAHPEAMRAALARHDEILRDAVEEHGGYVVKTTGDGLHAAFALARDAVSAALDAQRRLVAEDWVLPEPLRVRMGLHTGAAELRDGDYYGSAVNRAARVSAAGHGGQILVSLVTEELVRDDVPAEASLVDLGEHMLRDVERPERVFQLSHPAITSQFPRLQTDERVSGNLPDARDSFVGRTRELAELDASLTLTPLVTLTGVGGVGKTRLALETARRAQDRFADGAWLVELAPVTDAELVGAATAVALGVRERPGEPVVETLRAWLARRQALLVLDNCEHVLGAVARLVDALVAAAPALRVIATSREALGIPGEQTRPVPSLGVPETAGVTIDDLRASDSIVLFADRACRADPTFEVDDSTAGAVVQICRRLDGIPLAIELAAARVRAMDAGEIARRLDERFRLLTGGSRTALERHQTLRAALDWSYDLLDPVERIVFDRLSVFRGGFTLDAAEHVVAGDGVDEHEVVDIVIRLVEKSLVLREPVMARYDMLETMRVYARDHLVESGDAASARERHAATFIAFTERHQPQLWDGGTWERERAELFADFDNIREAFDWMVESGAAERALDLFLGIDVIWAAYTSPRDGLEQMQRALGASNLTPKARARALAQAARLAFLAGDPAVADALAVESTAVADAAGIDVPAIAMGTRGFVAMYDDDDARALPLLQEYLELARA
ncbi:MAG: adenylate/guanylate cyclase domain-containing protein, partial [Acidimicrobiia bacterium]|nr:adenylate/guanylate cyclase domain-containing protein [Acidimicrobiia bacterium]